MPGKLRVHGIRCIQQRLGTGQVCNVGVVLMRKHRVVRQAEFLRAFDLRIPIRAFDQATHQAQLVFAAKGDDVLNQIKRPRLVGLHGQTKALPGWVMFRHQRGQCLKHIKRQFQPVNFFSINRQVDIGLGCQLAQRPHSRHQLGHHSRALRVFITRVEGAQLDGYTII